MALDLVHNPAALAAALTETNRLVEAQLDALLPVPESAEARLIEAMRYSVLNGGKRMRAFLVMQTAQLFSVNQTCAARGFTGSGFAATPTRGLAGYVAHIGPTGLKH